MNNNEDKFQPKSMEQMVDMNERIKKASDLFGTKMKDILNEVEKEFQVTFQLGLDKTNPFAYIVPIYLPKNTKEYEQPPLHGPDTDGGTTEGKPSTKKGA